MAEELVYDACLEVRPDGACLAQLCDMPACFACGADEAEALRILEARIPAYFAWLARHDEYTPVMRGPFRVTVAEALRVADPTTGAFFQSDAQPVSSEDRDWYLALLDWSYGDLQDALGAIPLVAWDVRLPAGRSPLTLAMEVTNGQHWLLSRVLPGPELELELELTVGVPPARIIQDVRDWALSQVRACTADACRRVADRDGGRWSLRKVLRRSILLVREATPAAG
jgi:predicted RNase H-like HicB family nuclease